MNAIISHPIVAIIIATLVSFVIGWFVCDTVRSKRLYRRALLELGETMLRHLRDQVPGHSSHGDHLLGHVERGDYSFSDLKTTAEEIKKLAHRLSHKEVAVNLLNSLCAGNSWRYKEIIARLPVDLKEAGLTLEELGSSDAEIASFPKKIAITEAKKSWGIMVNNLCTAHNHLLAFQEWIEVEGLALADCGITEEDLTKAIAHAG